MNIAVLITGDVRECSAKYNLHDYFANCDVYCGTYEKHKKFATSLGKNNQSILINQLTNIRLPCGINKEEMQGGMLQWLHLDNIINKYESNLLEYDVIMKYRFDYLLRNKSFQDKIIVGENNKKFYSDTDKVFYCDSESFIRIFKGYYNILNNYTFNPDRDPNDDSLETSWKSEPALRMHIEKKGLRNVKLQFEKGKLDRGDHNKIRADGNRRLFLENGSFSSDKYWS